MPNEIEIKLHIPDPVSFLRNLKRLGAIPANKISPRVHELNLLFDTPQSTLKKRGQLLRIRTESPAPLKKSRRPTPARHLLTFKAPPASTAASSRHKVREETEFFIPDPAALQKIFESLGLHNFFRYEKFRTTWKLPSRHKWAAHLLIELDETPIGTFAELEGPPAAIDRAASLLGFSPRDFITKNYLVLYLDHCRLHHLRPSHMLFPANP